MVCMITFIVPLSHLSAQVIPQNVIEAQSRGDAESLFPIPIATTIPSSTVAWEVQTLDHAPTLDPSNL